MPDHFYIYPAYLGRGFSRSEGRRVGVNEALLELTTEEVVQAAKRLGYKAEVEADKQYPRDVAGYAGRVKVTKRPGVSKARFLHLLTAELRARRPSVGRS
jgi:signal recognition particle subunit SEC65